MRDILCGTCFERIYVYVLWILKNKIRGNVCNGTYKVKMIRHIPTYSFKLYRR